jgi:hypothetical protein
VHRNPDGPLGEFPLKPHGPPRRQRRSHRRHARESTIAIIDQLLMRQRSMSLNGEPTQLPTIDVIILQLLQKEMAGSLRARNTLLKYEEFARRRSERKLEVHFAESDYTRSIVAGAGDDNG